MQLIADYEPKQLIIVGDLVHDHSASAALQDLLVRLGGHCEVITIAGNHDRKLHAGIALVESFSTAAFEFHHGHCARDKSGSTQIIGHFHPAATLRDGAGLRLKFPVFVQEPGCWILPAFSPWAAGSNWMQTNQSQVWLCTPGRILPLEPTESAA